MVNKKIKKDNFRLVLMTYYIRTVSTVSFSRVEHFNKTLRTILMLF